MFESHEKLADDIRSLLSALRETGGGGRYACLLEPRGVSLEDAEPGRPSPWALRQFLERHAAGILAIPVSLHGGSAMDDLFGDWEQDAFFLAVVNGRVAVVVACPDPAALEERGQKLLRVVVDRLLRYNSAWRQDERGRGLFFSRPRLDTVVIARPDGPTG
jgi:hypothetical protein